MNDQLKENEQQTNDLLSKIVQRGAQRKVPPLAMPQYVSHKHVWALKIAAIEILCATEGEGPDEPAAILTPGIPLYGPFSVSKEYYQKHKPQVGGYFVVYKDGYQSFSPAAVFEEGTTAVAQQRADEEDIMPVLPIFGYRALNESGQAHANVVARAFSETLRVLERSCPPGREFSIVRTKLEEACMFAKKAVACDPRYQAGDLRSDIIPAMFGGGPSPEDNRARQEESLERDRQKVG